MTCRLTSGWIFIQRGGGRPRKFWGLAFLVAMLASPSAIWAGLSAQADSLDFRIRKLAAAARFSEAGSLAVELRHLDATLGADPEHLRWYDVWIETLEASGRLDEEGKRALAEANDLEPTIQKFLGDGHLADAETQIRRQMDLRSAALGADHPEVAYSRISLSHCLMSLGKLWDAETPAREAGEVIRSAFGERHFLSLSTQGLIAQIEVAQGEYESAEAIHSEMVSLRRNRYGKTDPMLATSLNALANVHLKQRDFLRAEQLLREALNINRDGEFEWLPESEAYREKQKLTLFESLARVLLAKGDFAGAKASAQEATDLLRTGIHKPSVLSSLLSIMSRAQAGIGEYEQANATARQILNMRQERFGNDHPTIVDALSGMAEIESESGHLAQSAETWTQAFELAGELLGPQHPTTLSLLDRLTATQLELGAYSVADSLLQVCAALGRDGLSVQSLRNAGVLRLALHQESSAEDYLFQSAQGFEEARKKAGQGIDRATFGEAPYFLLAAAQLAQNKGDAAWNSIEKGQGRVLVDLLAAAGDRRLPPVTTSRLVALYKRVDRSEREVEALQTAVRTDTSVQENLKAAVDRRIQAHADLVQLETEVAETHPVPSGQPFDLNRVQSSLSNDSAIIGWLDVQTRPQETHSWAYIVRDTGPVHWIELGVSESTDQFAQFRARIARILDSALGARVSHSLDEESARIWEGRFAPLELHLTGVQHLVVVGTGAMSGVPLECLRSGESEYLGDRYTISYVPSATVHAWIRERPTRLPQSEARALFVGDPPFREDHLRPDRPVQESGSTIVPLSTLRGALSGDRQSLRSLPRLWWSRQEVLESAERFDEATVLLGADASEQKLSHLSESGDLSRFTSLHFATHALVDAQSSERSALALSQLGLAAPGEGTPPDEPLFDGLLSARDIVRTWTLNADLVVLSACETGLGRRVVGEGYVGFSHAFLQAGANTVLASLWKVDDRATALLMSRFYEEWRSDLGDRGLANALQNARHWLRTFVDADGNEPFAHPAYWSGFVLIGSPG